MKVRFHCVKKLTDIHDVDVALTDLIMYWPPSCCGLPMTAVDQNEWQRVSRVLDRANTDLRNAGLPDLAEMLFEAKRA